VTDRLCDMVVATSRHAGQHALDDEGVEQVGGAERLPGAEADLLTSRRPGPWPVDFDEAAAEHDRARRCALPVAGAFAGGESGSLDPIASVSSACIIWDMTTSPVAEANAWSPSLIASATSASATVTSSGSSATRAALLASATVTTGTFFFTVVPFL
jgi:hypothetical protein